MKRRIRRTAFTLPILLAALSVGAAPTGSTIPLDPHGDGFWGASGGPFPLTTTSLLVPAIGPDGQFDSDDDVTLLVTGIDGTPSVTPLATPFHPYDGLRTMRFSATRAMTCTRGPDGLWGTMDDTALLLDRLGSQNEVTPITVGYLRQSGAYTPVPLTSDTALIVTRGPDGSVQPSDDDTIALVENLGGTPTVTQLPAPFLHFRGGTRPVPLSPTSFLAATYGPDGTDQTADDVTYLFTDVGGLNTRTDLATPFAYGRRPGQPVRISPTRAVMSSVGPDGEEETDDDRVYLLDDLGGANTVTSITVPYIIYSGAGQPAVITGDRVVVCTLGADGSGRTVDDSLALISGLGGTTSVTDIPVGVLGGYGQCRPVRLTPTSCAVVTHHGTDGTMDAVKIVDDLDGTPVVTGITVPGVVDGSVSLPARLSSSALMLTSGGPDGTLGGVDEEVSVISGIGGTPTVETVPVGNLDDRFDRSFAARSLGGGRGVLVAGGPNGHSGSGGDDFIQLLHDLPQGDTLSVKKILIKAKAAKPEKGEKFKVQGSLTLEETDLFGKTDIIVSVGNAAQTLPAGVFVLKNQKYTYKDKKGVNGPIRKFVFSAKKGTVKIKGKGVGTGAETTAAGYIAFGLDCEAFTLNQVYAGVAGKKGGVKYKAPK